MKDCKDAEGPGISLWGAKAGRPGEEQPERKADQC